MHVWLIMPLYMKKIINRKELLSFEKSQSFLFGHPVKNKKKGLNFLLEVLEWDYH